MAAESPLEFPADLGGQWNDFEFLRNRLRGQWMDGQSGYVEASVLVVTGP